MSMTAIWNGVDLAESDEPVVPEGDYDRVALRHGVQVVAADATVERTVPR